MFNVIVGTGALTMPKAFASAGWLVSLILVVILAGIRSVRMFIQIYLLRSVFKIVKPLYNTIKCLNIGIRKTILQCLTLLLMCHLCCLSSYVTATFVIETMASANGVRRWRKMQSRQSVCLTLYIIVTCMCT